MRDIENPETPAKERATSSVALARVVAQKKDLREKRAENVANARKKTKQSAAELIPLSVAAQG